jgi:hypothetical protein
VVQRLHQDSYSLLGAHRAGRAVAQTRHLPTSCRAWSGVDPSLGVGLSLEPATGAAATPPGCNRGWRVAGRTAQRLLFSCRPGFEFGGCCERAHDWAAAGVLPVSTSVRRPDF